MSDEKELNIQISEDIEPTYSNMIQTTHSDDEFPYVLYSEFMVQGWPKPPGEILI